MTSDSVFGKLVILVEVELDSENDRHLSLVLKAINSRSIRISLHVRF
jgi:hypothetical protein